MTTLFAAVLTVLVATAMSASFVHKEIEIGHNGVHYKISVDADGHQHGNSHDVGDLEGHDSETEHHNDVGNIGIHYEVPHPDHGHQHHHDEEEKHGVVLHIELGGGSDHGNNHETSDEHELQDAGSRVGEHHTLGDPEVDEHDLEHEDDEDNEVEHHTLKHHHSKRHGLKHHVDFELGHNKVKHQELAHNDFNPYDIIHHDTIPHDLESYSLTHPAFADYLKNALLKHHNLVGQYGIHNPLVPESQGWVNQETGHPNIQLYDFKHHQLGQYSDIGHHQIGNGEPHVLGHQAGSLWHPVGSGIVQPVSVPHFVPVLNDYGHQQVQSGQPLIGLGVIHGNHYADLHH